MLNATANLLGGQRVEIILRRGSADLMRQRKRFTLEKIFRYTGLIDMKLRLVVQSSSGLLDRCLEMSTGHTGTCSGVCPI